jgi:hypothetical protein
MDHEDLVWAIAGFQNYSRYFKPYIRTTASNSDVVASQIANKSDMKERKPDGKFCN